MSKKKSPAWAAAKAARAERRAADPEVQERRKKHLQAAKTASVEADTE